MYAPSLRLATFNSLPERARIIVLTRTLQALTAANVAYLATHPNMPALYKSGVRYIDRVPCVDGECWQDVLLTLSKRRGNCKELACWRVAELVVAGEQASHDVTRARTEIDGDAMLVTYHVRVRRGDGTIEDPSRRLGMR